ncbi:hypothetical protein [Sulfitobacter aestuariivivens]|nr:hypothetical protein [Sulfitobacter aestuariivivens]
MLPSQKPDTRPAVTHQPKVRHYAAKPRKPVDQQKKYRKKSKRRGWFSKRFKDMAEDIFDVVEDIFD